MTGDAVQERSIEISERDEEPVVEKRARVKEEVVVSKDVGERTEQVRDKVRRTQVEVEKGTRSRTCRACANAAAIEPDDPCSEEAYAYFTFV